MCMAWHEKCHRCIGLRRAVLGSALLSCAGLWWNVLDHFIQKQAIPNSMVCEHYHSGAFAGAANCEAAKRGFDMRRADSYVYINPSEGMRR